MEKESKEDTVTYSAGSETVTIPKPRSLKGLGGVLILVGMGLIVTPIRIVIELTESTMLLLNGYSVSAFLNLHDL